MDVSVSARPRVWPGEPFPRDPFDGLTYSFTGWDEDFVVRSSGPDGEIGSADDLVRALAAGR